MKAPFFFTGLALALALFAATEARSQSQWRLFEGHVSISVKEGARYVEVGSTSFSLKAGESDWSLLNSYAASRVQQQLIYSGGKAYTVTSDLDRLQTGAAALNSLDDLLVSAPEFSRLIYSALCMKDDVQASNAPVAFLDPRHPALHAYDMRLQWSRDSFPSFPESAEFTIARSRIDKVVPETIEYFYRDSLSPKKALLDFAESQTIPARFAVIAWTNSPIGRVPQSATLEHRYHSSGRTIDRRHQLWVTNVAYAGNAPLLSQLPNNTRIQHVVQGTNYSYIATNGVWLSDAEATRSGVVQTRAKRATAAGVR